eukprot:1150935-Pelagomonas_calceolata.AAC.9
MVQGKGKPKGALQRCVASGMTSTFLSATLSAASVSLGPVPTRTPACMNEQEDNEEATVQYQMRLVTLKAACTKFILFYAYP